jgi:hypothetical protein
MMEQPAVHTNQLPIMDSANELQETSIGRNEVTVQSNLTRQHPSSNQQRRRQKQ